MKYETQNTGIENMRYDFMPVGSIVPFASDIIPLGWLLCDGAPIERSRYPELYDLIGDKLPDHRGMFLRGNDNGRGIDAGRILGSEQGDAIRNITGTIEAHGSSAIGQTGIFRSEGSNGVFLVGSTTPYYPSYDTVISSADYNALPSSYVNFDTSKVVPTADENRPKNNSVNYIIKALHIANPSMEYQVADGLNHKIETNLIEMKEAELNNTGAHIGYNGIKYIQDTGDKVAGRIYYDKLQNGLFKCLADTSDIINSSINFVDVSNKNNDSLRLVGITIYNKEIPNTQVSFSENIDSYVNDAVNKGYYLFNLKVVPYGAGGQHNTGLLPSLRGAVLPITIPTSGHAEINTTNKTTGHKNCIVTTDGTLNWTNDSFTSHTTIFTISAYKLTR